MAHAKLPRRTSTMTSIGKGKKKEKKKERRKENGRDRESDTRYFSSDARLRVSSKGTSIPRCKVPYSARAMYAVSS